MEIKKIESTKRPITHGNARIEEERHCKNFWFRRKKKSKDSRNCEKLAERRSHSTNR